MACCGQLEPSQWVRRFAPAIAPGGAVLDLACGAGRHTRWLAQCGYRVTAVDRDPPAIQALQTLAGVEASVVDAEDGIWRPPVGRFDAVVVTHYLHRPLLPLLAEALAQGGLLIYETFMVGNARFGKPSSPTFLLRPDELLEVYRGVLDVVAFEQGEVAQPRPAMLQRLCARKGAGGLLPE